MQNKIKIKKRFDSFDSLGEVIEIYQIQILIIILIFLNIFIHYLQTIQELIEKEAFMKSNSIQAINFFNTFSSIVLNLETVMVAVSFGGKIFTHFGYITDVINLFIKYY